MKRSILMLALFIAALSSTTSAFAKGRGGGCSDCKPSPEYLARQAQERKAVEIACMTINGRLDGSYADYCTWQSASNPRISFTFGYRDLSDNDFYVDNDDTVRFVTACEEIGGTPATIAKGLFCKISGKHHHELKFSDYLKALNKKK